MTMAKNTVERKVTEVMIEKMIFAANILNSLLIESDEIAIGQSEITNFNHFLLKF
jgi:hypothetical protein